MTRAFTKMQETNCECYLQYGYQCNIVLTHYLATLLYPHAILDSLTDFPTTSPFNANRYGRSMSLAYSIPSPTNVEGIMDTHYYIAMELMFSFGKAFALEVRGY